MSEDAFVSLREEMVSRQILGRRIDDARILEAFKSIPRHIFVPDAQKRFAYSDSPLPIGSEQTISQPYMVALMTQHLKLRPKMRVLEVGCGSGYQAAILAFLGAQVYTIERFPSLAKKAKKVLDSLKLAVKIKVGDGTLGWPEQAPYDRIIVTAAVSQTPPALIEQLKIGGKIVIPLGERFHQDLTVIDRVSQDKISEQEVCGCRFVPLVGEYGWSR
ncbi:MAG: protein-L-isoaspartate(D-aspartate) O-methyltransferase [Candidatus Omnitrophota bacterium]